MDIFIQAQKEIIYVNYSIKLNIFSMHTKENLYRTNRGDCMKF